MTQNEIKEERGDAMEPGAYQAKDRTHPAGRAPPRRRGTKEGRFNNERQEMNEATESPCGTCGLPEVCTPKQWAEFFKVSPKTVYRMCEEGRLHTVKVRGAVRICRDKSFQLMGVSL